MFKPSEKQLAIFDFVRNGEGSAIIKAVAGAGKTTTIVEALKYIPESKSVLMLAFNKSIADEMKKRAPGFVKVGTFHSVGYGVLARFLGSNRLNVNSNKNWKVLDKVVADIYGTEEDAEKKARLVNALYGAFVVKLVALAKSAGLGFTEDSLADASDPESFKKLIDHHDISLDSDDADDDFAIRLAQDVLKRGATEACLDDIVDFDDMLYIPLIEGLTFYKNDFVLIDEAQDTNAVQLELLRRMLKDDGRLIAVGDPCQSIYGFRGADSEAMNNIATTFNTVELPLTVSYRCPQAVVAAAKEYVSYIEPHESAPVGVVETIDKYTAQDFNRHDVILCRVTAPLIDLAYWFLQRGIGCRVLGRDIGQGLISLIKRMGATDLNELEEKLSAHVAREVAKLEERKDKAKAEALRDRIDCMFHIINNLHEDKRTIRGLIDQIDHLFRDTNGVLTLATVHKAKGLEWENVYILDKGERMPSRWAKKGWQLKQEHNLIYVAYTRAKQRLAFITLGGRADTKTDGPKTDYPENPSADELDEAQVNALEEDAE